MTSSNLDAVFTRNRRKIVGLAAKMLGVSDAEDAYQDAVIKAMEVADGLTFENDKHADSWFYSVGLNVCRDRMRFVGRRSSEVRISSMEEADEFLPAPEVNGGAEYRVSPNGSDSEVMISDEDIRDMINRLPKDQSEILRKVYYENLSHREIGQQLGITEAAARVRTCRAMEALRGIMKREVA